MVCDVETARNRPNTSDRQSPFWNLFRLQSMPRHVIPDRIHGFSFISRFVTPCVSGDSVRVCMREFLYCGSKRKNHGLAGVEQRLCVRGKFLGWPTCAIRNKRQRDV